MFEKTPLDSAGIDTSKGGAEIVLLRHTNMTEKMRTGCEKIIKQEPRTLEMGTPPFPVTRTSPLSRLHGIRDTSELFPDSPEDSPEDRR
eukprot:scaffold11641_cov80-Skeletonema_menzelii.AAC.1